MSASKLVGLASSVGPIDAGVLAAADEIDVFEGHEDEDGYESGYMAGRSDERRAVVAYLTDRSECELAEEFESGAHWKAGAK